MTGPVAGPADAAGPVSMRPADVVMAPETLGAARLTRYSFSRMLIRAASRHGWTVERTRFEIDADGRGEAVYEWHAGDRVVSFVAFTTTIDVADHTDRVIADRWEIAAVLVDGTVDEVALDRLRIQVPLQEGGRFDDSVLVLTRGNRSVRFFDELVDTLARGEQPDPDRVGAAGYIMRSTAFYGNAKFGLRPFAAIGADHPFAAPYRAQMAAALLFRELSYDVVEHCAGLRGDDQAVGFQGPWRTFFGLGNATGLGLVPYAFSHPAIMDAWAEIRELALAQVRAYPITPARRQTLADWIDRARRHFATGTNASCSPFLSPAELVPVVDSIALTWTEAAATGDVDGFDRLYRWAEKQGAETTELVVSLLIELHEGDDDMVDARLAVDESSRFDPTMPVDQLGGLIAERFGWIDRLGLDGTDARHYWWAVSDNTDEPRRARYGSIDPAGRDVAIDLALRIQRLRRVIAATPAATGSTSTAGDLIRAEPELALAVDRVQSDRWAYGEPRDNACALDFLPLQTQRFQLACYGMDNFSPQSTDWLRVTLFQGAPRAADLADRPGDDWVLPPRPGQVLKPVEMDQNGPGRGPSKESGP